MRRNQCIHLENCRGPSALQLRDGHESSERLEEPDHRQGAGLQLRREHHLEQPHVVLLDPDDLLVDEWESEDVPSGVQNGIDVVFECAVVELDAGGREPLDVGPDLDLAGDDSVGQVVVDSRMLGVDAVRRLQSVSHVIKPSVGFRFRPCVPEHGRKHLEYVAFGEPVERHVEGNAAVEDAV